MTFTTEPGTNSATVYVAECGCRIEGRFIRVRPCTVIDLDTDTGTKVGQHTRKLRKDLNTHLATIPTQSRRTT